MSNYKHTSIVGDECVVLETDDSDFMREYVNNEDVVCIDNVISQTNFGEIKTGYMDAIAETDSENSSLAAAVSALEDRIRKLSSDFMHLRFDVNSLKSKEKRNAQ